MIIHDTNDRTVPFAQAIKLNKKLTSPNIPHKLISLQGADHDLNMKDLPTRNMIYKEMVDWVWTYRR
ncbi:MAG: prolyl oligopeptidase family serine peptidase [Chitinophagaceae bacterium]